MHQNFPQGGIGTQGRIQSFTQEKKPPPQLNLTLQKIWTIKKLKDHSWVVLTVDKGVTMVIMDREDYTDEAQSLLADTTTYRKVYPPVHLPQNFMAKIHKIGTPLGQLLPIGGPSYMRWPRSWPTSIALWLAIPHTISKNNQHIIQHIKEVKLEPGEVMTSYDIKSLFTSVPVDPSINIVKQNYNRTNCSHKGPTCLYNK